MDIERINENTLKLFITYSDIEDRGYSREEIWYNRSKGEELFWDVIGEVNTEDYFDLDGPIWIHINASEQGLEVIVTRANMNADHDTEMFEGFEDNKEVAAQLREMESVIFETLDNDSNEEQSPITNARFTFKDIDELIPLAKRIVSFGLASSLYKFEGQYYLHVDFTEFDEQRERKNMLALIKEYLKPSRLTIYRLQEYGDVIMAENAFEMVVEYFG
ncbi:adaptor protein MecA [Lysinibacillus sp. 54212]|uniref:adaptor protein MecA n=1 Tax=Lysinibacillus sp. 54212 TaxID=3119829 RepID=UPI002FCA465D